MSSVIPRRLCLFVSVCLGGAGLWAQHAEIWRLGAANENPHEFGEPTGSPESAPGSAGQRDDHFYLAGAHAPPIGTLAADEPWPHLERSLTAGDPIVTVHFIAPAGSDPSAARGVVRGALIWPGWWNASTGTLGQGPGSHEIAVRVNGTEIGRVLAAAGTTPFRIAFRGGEVGLMDGPASVTLDRVGGSPSGWISLDYLALEWDPTGFFDTDGDGVPRFFERDAGTDDEDPADAGLDLDGDGLDLAAEYLAGTDPRGADTDGDSLLDGAETRSDPGRADSDADGWLDGAEVVRGTAPDRADSDGDGVPDALEEALGYDPISATDVPSASPRAIGIALLAGTNAGQVLSPAMATGWYPQANWNQTRVLGWSDQSGTEEAIARPVAGQVVDSNGTVTPIRLSWNSGYPSARAMNAGKPTERLLNAYLAAAEGGFTLEVAGIPFSRYDVVVYVGSGWQQNRGRVRLNGNGAGDRRVEVPPASPARDFLEVGSLAARPTWGNTLVFHGLNQPTLRLQVLREEAGAYLGIHGFQLIEAGIDADGDGLPDDWERRHGLRPETAEDALSDMDGDTLTALDEHARGSDPRRSDTDRDGLDDSRETGTGNWLGPHDTGSDPRRVDSDGDRLSDHEEVFAPFGPLNPNRADSDGDGLADGAEIELWGDPLDAAHGLPPLPAVSVIPGRFRWVFENLQVFWERRAGSPHQSGRSSLLSARLQTLESTSWTSCGWELVSEGGQLQAVFHSTAEDVLGWAGGDDLWVSLEAGPDGTLRELLRLGGDGLADLSVPFDLEIEANRIGSGSDWSLLFRIRRADDGRILATTTRTGLRAAPALIAGSLAWRAGTDALSPLRLASSPEVTVVRSRRPVTAMPGWAHLLDEDWDGLADAWERAHGLDPTVPSDAGGDDDGDGLSALEEAAHGLHPRLADTDEDGLADGDELAAGSDPRKATSLPIDHASATAPGGDFNGDGLPDAWQARFGAWDIALADDSDGDGALNRDEARAGTDPFEASSFLWLEGVWEGGALTLSWPDLPEKSWFLLDADGLVEWEPSNAPVTGDGTLLSAAVPVPELQERPRFWRVAVEDRDIDADGASDWAETALGTDPAAVSSAQATAWRRHPATGEWTRDVPGDLAAHADLATSYARDADAGRDEIPAPTPAEAARFLMQASFGPTRSEIAQVRALGLAGWLDDQIEVQPPTLHAPYIEELIADRRGPRVRRDLLLFDPDDAYIPGPNVRTAFARGAIQGTDQLRQRVAFALSQILVVSRRNAELDGRPWALMDYYDIFVRNAFGNYEDILTEVTWHPVMARYLSHLGNEKADPSINRYPDENYAREVMQLFSIGLWELNPDGSRILDEEGAPIQTYDNAEITAMARVLTGFWYADRGWGEGGWSEADWVKPLGMHTERHDFGAKQLVRGYVVPAREPTEANARKDVRDALRCLFQHPNTPPFVSRQLIQFLVTDNPSLDYVRRVQDVFVDNGTGVRGDLGAVVRAILLDPEARHPEAYRESRSFGRLREPVMRTMHFARLTGLDRFPELLWWDWGEFQANSFQEPMNSPSVFNFYRPDHVPPGVLTEAGLNGPVFEITHTFTAIAFPNLLLEMMDRGFSIYDVYRFEPDYGELLPLAGDPDALLDAVNLLVCAGSMSLSTRDIIREAVEPIATDAALDRVRVALYLALISPDGAVQR